MGRVVCAQLGRAAEPGVGHGGPGGEHRPGQRARRHVIAASHARVLPAANGRRRQRDDRAGVADPLTQSSSVTMTARETAGDGSETAEQEWQIR